MLFEDVTTIGTWTWPSHASLFTGRPPWVHGAHFAHMRGDFSIPPEGLALLREVYDGEVLQVDFRLHEVLETWNATRGVDGIIAVTADHGEFLGERGLMEHGRVVYPEVARVPMVIAGPGLPRGERVQHPVQLHDLYPTLLELSHIPAKQPQGVGEARSLMRLLEGPQKVWPIVSTAWRDHFWAQEGGPRFEQGYRSWREGDEIIVFGEDSGLEYDRLHDDPGMQSDLSAQFPERAAELRERAEPTLHPSVETGTIEIDPEAAEQLRALDYVK